MKGGEKVQIFGFFETKKLDFLRKELSVEKTFLPQEAGMIRISFDKTLFDRGNLGVDFENSR